MAENLELKLKLESFNQVEKILSDKGILLMDILEQKDIYYKIKDGLLKLRIEGDSFQLIKYNRDETGLNRWSNYNLIKMEGENIEEVFANIFEIETVVKKSRRLFILLNTRIHLDEVEGLGKFLELETIVDKDKEDAKERFEKVKEILEISSFGEINCSYRDLLINRNI